MSKSLGEKIVAIMGEVNAIGQNGFNKNQNYRYAQAVDVIREVRQSLVKHNIRLKSKVLDRKREEKITVLTIEYSLIDIESGEVDSTTLIAEGMDGGDKAANKALTSGLKYFFRDTFLLEFADDPEQETSNNNPSDKQKQQYNPQQQQKQPAQKTQRTQQTTATSTPTPQTGNQGPQKLISKAQLGKLASEGSKRGLNDDWQRAWCVTFYKVDSRKKLTASQASKMIEDFMKLTQDQLSEKIKKVKEHFEKIKGGVA